MLFPTRTSRYSSILLVTAVLTLFASACGFHAPGLGKFTQVIDISIPEKMLAKSSPSFTVGDHDFSDPGFKGFSLELNDGTLHFGGTHNFYDSMLDNVRLQLHDGFLRFVGTNTQPDGSRVPGSIDLFLGAEDGRLVARIIAIDIPGISLDDPLVVEINHEMQVEFSQDLSADGAEVLFQDVQVTEEELRMKIQVTISF
jgi:hypothetical protein